MIILIIIITHFINESIDYLVCKNSENRESCCHNYPEPKETFLKYTEVIPVDKIKAGAGTMTLLLNISVMSRCEIHIYMFYI